MDTSTVIGNHDMGAFSQGFHAKPKLRIFLWQGVQGIQNQVRKYLENLTLENNGHYRCTELSLDSDRTGQKLVRVNQQRSLDSFYQVALCGLRLHPVEGECLLRDFSQSL
ncbi:MAG TPA: hypothetical protein VGM27_04605 [Acidobacteriaceae bacterium]